MANDRPTIESHGAESSAEAPTGKWPFQQERLNLPAPLRIPGGALLGFTATAPLGIAQGGKVASLVFRAEHAHILPTTTPGWYFYHKSKNYHVMLGAIKKGFKYGAKGAFSVTSFMAIEEVVDKWRGTSDFLSTTAAGLCCGGAYSLWKNFTVPTAARTIRIGLGYGLLFGILQDAIGFFRGRRPGYLNYVLGPHDTGVTASEDPT